MNEEYGNDGGFNTSSPSGGNGASSGGKGGKSSKRSIATCTSVTIKQLVHATLSPNETFQIDGKDISSVRIVARVVNIASETAKDTIYLDDGTWDPISVVMYRQDTIYFLERENELRSGRPLVDAVIHTKAVSGGMELSTSGPENMRIVKDGNVLTHHILDCINTHLLNTRGPLPRSGSNNNGMSASASALYAAQLNLGGGGDVSSNPNNDMVYNAFVEFCTTSEDGCNASAVFLLLQKDPSTRHITMAMVEKACEDLMFEGKIYSTIDDVTFRPTA